MTGTSLTALKPPRSFIQPGWIIGANMIFRREVLEAIEGFDPDLGPGTPFIADDPDGLARQQSWPVSDT